MYYIDIKHEGLGKFRRVQGADQYVVEQRAHAQRQMWDEQWARKCEIEKTRAGRMQFAFLKEEKKKEAIARSEDAQKEISALETVLQSGVAQKGESYWEALYDKMRFEDAEPIPPGPQENPDEPLPDDPVYRPRSDLFSWLFRSIRQQREQAAAQRYHAAHDEWTQAIKEQTRKHELARNQFAELLREWEERKAKFESDKAQYNTKVDAFRELYMAGDEGAVTEYIDMVLYNSEYPECFPKQRRIDFIPETGVTVIDFELPALEMLPTLKSVKYIQSRDVFEDVLLRDNEISHIYDDAMYQTALRTLHEIFISDEANAITSVTFNGWVNFTDKATGQPARSCIMSVQTTKEAFGSINLAQVEPKACFRSLKGVGSAKLAGMSAVVPILQLNKSDERFVPAHDAIDGVDAATNIAAISWEEFEYLVRDIFEKEFSAHGGEVKITRASRDHGVDAVAFDPDPIRGGKIVIQAKRYTNVVGVSAVRDLYGTLINEGANRGILVTTSQYGPDSYAFAKDKPITLLDGGNLLSLLERHGHKARIDLEEAKKLGALRDER